MKWKIMSYPNTLVQCLGKWQRCEFPLWLCLQFQDPHKQKLNRDKPTNNVPRPLHPLCYVIVRKHQNVKVWQSQVLWAISNQQMSWMKTHFECCSTSFNLSVSHSLLATDMYVYMCVVCTRYLWSSWCSVYAQTIRLLYHSSTLDIR